MLHPEAGGFDTQILHRFRRRLAGLQLAERLGHETGRKVESVAADLNNSEADAVVDAALAGLDHGELVTIPSLPDIADWQAYEAARQELMPNLSRDTSAERYTRSVA